MGERTEIAWTNHTFNAWHGCTRVSAGCLHCYAEAESHRRGFAVWGAKAPRRKLSEHYWNEPFRWNRKAKANGARELVFCSSMADVFEDHKGPMVDHNGDPIAGSVEEERARLWEVIARTPWLIWQLLTKRPENVMGMVPYGLTSATWPDNLWVGTTTESQETLDERGPELLEIPSVVRFLSYEPAMGPLNLSSVLPDWDMPGDSPTYIPGVEWVIVGGESGGGARPFDPAWATSVIDQCHRSATPRTSPDDMVGVPVFVKQMGAPWARERGLRIKGRSKGQDPQDWDEALRVQEMPRPTVPALAA